jgi:hypothetical protein
VCAEPSEELAERTGVQDEIDPRFADERREETPLKIP